MSAVTPQQQEHERQRRIADLIESLHSIAKMSRQAARGPAHVAKLTLGMMADIAEEAIAKAGKP